MRLFWILQHSRLKLSISIKGSLKATCEASNGIASQEEPCERTFTFEHLRPQQPQQCDLAFEYGEFQMRCIPGDFLILYYTTVTGLDCAVCRSNELKLNVSVYLY